MPKGDFSANSDGIFEVFSKNTLGSSISSIFVVLLSLLSIKGTVFTVEVSV